MKTMPVLLLLLMLSCSPLVQESRIEPQGQEIQLKPVAGDPTEPRFDEYIDARASAANLPPLRSKQLSRDDLEFRVWVGFGKKPLEGFVIKRTGGEWEGTFLESMNMTTRPPYQRSLALPKSGWDDLWGHLLETGLLTLPDFSQLKDYQPVVDGTSYVVELRKDGVYRTYSYMNPDYQKWEEAKQMLKIADLLYSRFRIKR